MFHETHIAILALTTVLSASSLGAQHSGDDRGIESPVESLQDHDSKEGDSHQNTPDSELPDGESGHFLGMDANRAEKAQEAMEKLNSIGFENTPDDDHLEAQTAGPLNIVTYLTRTFQNEVSPAQSEINDACRYYDSLRDWRCERTFLDSFHRIEIAEVRAPTSIESKLQWRLPAASESNRTQKEQSASNVQCVNKVQLDIEVQDGMQIDWKHMTWNEHGHARSVRAFRKEEKEGQRSILENLNLPSGSGASVILVADEHQCFFSSTTIESTENESRANELRIPIQSFSGTDLGISIQLKSKLGSVIEKKALAMRSPPSEVRAWFPWKSVLGGSLTVLGASFVAVPLLIEGADKDDIPYVAGGAAVTLGGISLLSYGLVKEVPEHFARKDRENAYSSFYRRIREE